MRTLAIIFMCVFFTSSGIATTGNAQQNSSSDIKGQTKALQQQMVGDKEIMDLILSLQNDPDVQQVLQDPEIMKAVNSGDINTLMGNPKFMRILDKNAVHDIGTKLQK